VDQCCDQSRRRWHFAGRRARRVARFVFANRRIRASVNNRRDSSRQITDYPLRAFSNGARRRPLPQSKADAKHRHNEAHRPAHKASPQGKKTGRRDRSKTVRAMWAGECRRSDRWSTQLRIVGNFAGCSGIHAAPLKNFRSVSGP
jgi:hypothetical protein